MNQLNYDTNQKPGFMIRQDLEFEMYFNSDIVSSEKIQFSRHYLENKMGLDLNEDSLIDFSAIGIKLFGCLVADITLEYEYYKECKMDG